VISKLYSQNNIIFFFSSRRQHTSFSRDWSSDVCSSDLGVFDEFAFTRMQRMAGQFLAGCRIERHQLLVRRHANLHRRVRAGVGRSEERSVGNDWTLPVGAWEVYTRMYVVVVDEAEVGTL